jgi:hypothetical protein
MVEEIITVFCICDDYLKTMQYKDNHQAQMSTSEVLTTAIVAARFFGGNYQKSRMFLSEHNYIKRMLSESRFIRRLNALDKDILYKLFTIMTKAFKAANPEKIYAIDSFPVPVCSNIRISRCNIYKNEKYRGYSAIRQSYFFGIKVHMLVTKYGEPVEFVIEPGSFSDIRVARSFAFDIPRGSIIHADRAYTDYDFEDYLELQRQIFLAARRKENAKRRERGMSTKIRKIIETSFSSIVNDFPRKIHAVTAKGFELKIIMFIFAYSTKLLVAT